ncbi:MAG: HlyD family efflux transporter periplasmic adaptor subunit [Candidatus Sulfotelmatobacter sp.]
MNLAEALDVLPEISTPTKGKRIFKMDPRLVGREHMEEEGAMFLAHVPGSVELFRLTPEQWKLAHFFDGQRSYSEVAELFAAETAIQLSEEDVRSFAEMMQDSNFWYQSPQEKNSALMEKLRERRKKQKKAKAGDMAHIVIAHWDADAWIEIGHRKLQFVYTPWFTALTLFAFAFLAYIFVSHWSQIGADTLEYYTFTDKSAADLAEFWILFFIMAFFHEGAHAITCKHYGGGVHKTGFHLIYLSPAFFVDVTEVWVYANRFQRVVTALAGIWTELIICSIATVVWWGTPPGGPVHDLAYKVVLIAGIAVVLMNLNPLIKLDGYYVLSETLGIDEIKERSTALLSNWVQKHVFRLPVEVAYVRPRLRWFFVPYAILSGLYSYLLLYAVARFVGNVFRHFSPEWAFLPTTLVALLIFKSRIIKLGKFMKTVYADKRNALARSMTPPRIAIFAAVLAALLGIPFFSNTVHAKFILEPVVRAVVRAEVPGAVVEVLVREGQKVEPGDRLLRLRNLDLESQQALTDADLQLARSRSTEAHMDYTDAGATEQEFQQDRQKSELLAKEVEQLQLRSPIRGSVVSPRPGDLLGSHLNAGATAVEVANLSTLRARLYLPEPEMREVRPGQAVSLRVDSSFRSFSGVVGEIALASTEIEPGLEPKSEYKGLLAPRWYAVTVLEPNGEGKLMYGMTGTAKIYTARHSLAGMVWRSASEFVSRKLW